MKQRLHSTKSNKKPSNIIYIEVDQLKARNQGLLIARQNNRSSIFEDRRFKKPKYKTKYQED